MKRLQMPYQFMLRSAAETPGHDYSRTAVAELDIKADAMALVRLSLSPSSTRLQVLGRIWDAEWADGRA
jgi:hypothetical protein